MTESIESMTNGGPTYQAKPESPPVAWPKDTYPSAFNPGPDSPGSPSLDHVHLQFEVIDPKDIAPNGTVLAGTLVRITGIAAELPVGCVVLYVGQDAWVSEDEPIVVALDVYSGATGSIVLRTVQDGVKGSLHAIGIREIQAWRTWFFAFHDTGSGPPGNAGDPNGSHVGS